MSKRWLFLLTLLWLIPVVCMSYFGYGSDEDAWIVGQEGLVIWKTGVYSISRSTGFPLHELLMSPLSVLGSWYACNAFSVLCGIVVIVFLYCQHQVRNFQYPTLTVITLIFLPQILINASSTLDYLPSLACWMAMYYFFLKKNYYLAAVFVGIACGFRPSNGAFVIPIVCILFLNKEYINGLKVFAVALFVGILAYSPVLINYGILDPTREVHIPFLQNLMIGGYQFLILFGVWQSLLIFVLLFLYRKKIISQIPENSVVVFHLCNILFWLIFFFGITSSESEYLFPIIPSVIFLFDEILSQKHFLILSISLLSFNVFSLEVLGGESGNRNIEPRIIAGYTYRDFQDRRFKLWYRDAVTNYRSDKREILMFGSAHVLANNPAWEYLPGHPNIIRQKHGNLCVSERILNPDQLKQLTQEGYTLYVWNKRKWEYLRLNVPNWEKYVIVVDDLEKFLQSKQEGELMQ